MADKATSAVAAVIAEAGHAPEPVVNDYGEDLLVQTSHAGRMDASRLWLQVKGTEGVERYRLKRGGMSLSVPYGHAVRWSRSTDLVTVVLWDVSNGRGWYALPSKQVDEWTGSNVAPKTTTLHFGEDDLLTAEVVDDLAWESRLNHYRHLILSARDREIGFDVEGEQGGRRKWSERRVVVALDFVHLLGLTELVDETEGAFRIGDEVRNIFAAFVKKQAEEATSATDLIYQAGVMAVAIRASEIGSGLALPRVLLEDAVEVLVIALGLKNLLDEERSR